MPFEEPLLRLLEHPGNGVYLVAALLLLALLVWGFARTGGGSRFPVEQRRKVKEEVVRMMRGQYQGLNCDGICQKLGVSPRDLRPLLQDLVEDRFLIPEGDPRDPVYRLRGLDNF